MDDSEQYLAAIKGDLPHMPVEVIREWLLPYAQLLEWPPAVGLSHAANRWHGILSHRPLEFWRKVRWRQETGVLELDDLDDQSRSHLLGIRDSHVLGINNAYSGIEDGKRRIASILHYVLKHGSIPSAISLLADGARLDVIDGHNRLVVYFLNRNPKFRNALPPDAAPFDPTVHKWIGSFSAS